MQYYIQEIAKNYLKNLSDEVKTIKAAPCFLYGTDMHDFLGGYNALNRLFRSLYSDLAANLSSFGMPLKEMEVSDAKNSDYTNSNLALLRVPNLLFVIGTEAEPLPDMTLRLDGGKLLAAAKELKITGVPALLSRLTDYGFTIDGLKKTVKEADTLLISYPDNRYVISALKALSEAMLLLNKGDRKKNKSYFYILHPGLAESQKVKIPKLTKEAVIRTLDIEKQRLAYMLDEMVGGECKCGVRMGGLMRNDWSCIYTRTAGNRIIMRLNTVQDRLDVKLNLQNIGKYTDIVAEYPDNIRETIKTVGWECGNCHDSCAGPFSFTLDGKDYNRCRCGGFLFQDIKAEEIPYCVDMLKREMAYLSEG